MAIVAIVVIGGLIFVGVQKYMNNSDSVKVQGQWIRLSGN
jgi:hypothetical protein